MMADISDYLVSNLQDLSRIRRRRAGVWLGIRDAHLAGSDQTGELFADAFHVQTAIGGAQNTQVSAGKIDLPPPPTSS